MGVQFQHKRVVSVAPFVADLDPNTAPPPEAQLFRLKDRPPYGGLTMATQGNTVFLDFRTAAGAPVNGATGDWQTWFLDEQSQVWTNALPVLKAANMDAYITQDIKSAVCWVQALAVYTVGAATTVTIRMMEV